MKRLLSAITLFLMAVSQHSCSVAMAASKNGTEMHELYRCRTREQFVLAGAQVISTERLASGHLVEVYQYKEATGSTGRALIHGLLDVGTLGIWEVVGTPIEGFCKHSEYYTLRVTFDEKNIATRVEIL
jgi:hypothetical protein